jgi:hypothetical protein
MKNLSNYYSFNSDWTVLTVILHEDLMHVCMYLEHNSLNIRIFK